MMVSTVVADRYGILRPLMIPAYDVLNVRRFLCLRIACKSTFGSPGLTGRLLSYWQQSDKSSVVNVSKEAMKQHLASNTILFCSGVLDQRLSDMSRFRVRSLISPRGVDASFVRCWTKEQSVSSKDFRVSSCNSMKAKALSSDLTMVGLLPM